MGAIVSMCFSKNKMNKMDGMPKRDRATKASKPKHKEALGACEPKRNRATKTSEPKHKEALGACEPKRDRASKASEPKRDRVTKASEPKHKEALGACEPKRGRASKASEPKRDRATKAPEPKHKEALGACEPKRNRASKASEPKHIEAPILRCAAYFSNGFVVSESTTSTLNEIMMALTTPNIIMLGVYGSSNAKKGTVVEKITRRINRDNLFDVIITASVMKKPDLKKIQAELGNMLGLQLRGEKTSKGRARLLCGKIKTVGRILIILDDVWGEINLARIGIPFGNDHMGCKILLISETQNVLSNQTNAQIEFRV